jgi:phosphoglycerate dehydrogenase-like enzyme
MGMDVHAYTLHPKTTPASRRSDGWCPPGTGDLDGTFPSKWFSGERTADLHKFLGSGLDLLLVALPLTPKTRGLIGEAEFRVLADTKKAFVSNIGRGPIINTDALISALDGGLIRGAALDVTDPEPLPDGHPLWSTKNVIITPHVSGMSTRYFERVFSILEYNLRRLSQGKSLVNRVSRREGY